MATAPGALELGALLTETYWPSRQNWSWVWPISRRREGVWLAGIALFLVLSGLVPLTFVMMTLLSLLALATCLRAYALHEYARQLTELAMQEQQGADDDTASTASGSSSAPGGGGGTTPARRRPRRPSLFTAVAAARPLSLLNLRLSLMDRDFTEQDFDLLVRLDELEAASRQDPLPPPLPEAQLALLPVHVHRSPVKKGKGKQPLVLEATLAAAPPKPLAAPAGAPLQVPRQPLQPPQRQGGALRPLHVPVLVEACPPPVADARGCGRPAPEGAEPGAACLATACNGGDCEIKAAYGCGAPGVGAAHGSAAACPSVCGSEGDEEAPVCSICLDTFEDGAKILSLPCRHEYHAECVTQWLRLKGADSTCPNCKGAVFSPEAGAAAVRAR